MRWLFGTWQEVQAGEAGRPWVWRERVGSGFCFVAACTEAAALRTLWLRNRAEILNLFLQESDHEGFELYG